MSCCIKMVCGFFSNKNAFGKISKPRRDWSAWTPYLPDKLNMELPIGTVLPSYEGLTPDSTLWLFCSWATYIDSKCLAPTLPSNICKSIKLDRYSQSEISPLLNLEDILILESPESRIRNPVSGLWFSHQSQHMMPSPPQIMLLVVSHVVGHECSMVHSVWKLG